MRMNWLGSMLKPRMAILLAFIGVCRLGLAQQVSYLVQPSLVQPSLIQPSLVQPSLAQPETMEPAPMVRSVQPAMLPEAPTNHRFLDRDNSILFVASAAFSAADFVVTKNNLHSGGQELNPITRVFSGSTPGLAMNFVGETVGVVGLSYFFHKMGHHKMERMVSMVNIGGSAAAVTFGLTHR